ncbi:MAG: glutamate--cysteine ligase [Leptospira sp.]|nr:glutamate--cysteine ligase [Leptospira sp.]NCS92435.1 glutamate--cysteine ligase [Leptospira sp.]
MNPNKLSLFHAYGIEAEYMIVDRDTLSVSPSAALLLLDEVSNIQNEITFDQTAWSNELASHLIEIKTNGPVENLDGIGNIFHEDVIKINTFLEKENLMLMPTAMHPWMNPSKDFVIWPHENQEIYNAYDTIFNCKGHGWSNLQSVHINLGYANEYEFRSLHAAIRILLPMIPALAASSPILEAHRSNYLDTRLNFYANNQKIIPEISGSIIPEVIDSEKEYRKIILEPMYKAIEQYDPNQILQDEWLNSRGAIARFDRSAIEIRLMDIQECPKADLSLVNIFVLFLKHLIENYIVEDMNSIPTSELKILLDSSIIHGTKTVILNSKLLKLLGSNQDSISVLDVFTNIPSIQQAEGKMLAVLKNHGNLSERILASLEINESTMLNSIAFDGKNNEEHFKKLKATYLTLCSNLQNNEIYIP